MSCCCGSELQLSWLASQHMSSTAALALTISQSGTGLIRASQHGACPACQLTAFAGHVVPLQGAKASLQLARATLGLHGSNSCSSAQLNSAMLTAAVVARSGYDRSGALLGPQTQESAPQVRAMRPQCQVRITLQTDVYDLHGGAGSSDSLPQLGDTGNPSQAPAGCMPPQLGCIVHIGSGPAEGARCQITRVTL